MFKIIVKFKIFEKVESAFQIFDESECCDELGEEQLVGVRYWHLNDNRLMFCPNFIIRCRYIIV